MSDYSPRFKPGQALTLTATGTITGGLLVTIAGATTAADSTTWLGVASQDATTGQQFGVYVDGVQRLTAGGAISAGDRLKCGASGKVVTLTAGTDAYDRLVGIALEAAAGDGTVFAAKLVR